MSTALTSFTHCFISPPNPPAATTTLLLLHGIGGNEHDLIPIGRELMLHAALFSLWGRVLERGMPRFFRRFAKGVFDIADIKRQAVALYAFLNAAALEYSVDRQRVIAVGYSNGANITSTLLLLHGAVLAGAILLRPMTPLKAEPLPELAGVPVLVLAGSHDGLVTIAETERLVGLLQTARATVTLTMLEQGHQLSQEDIRIAREWLQAGHVVIE
ncbi:alpha/beta hydrolase [uncultured Chloroflexus sp.]|uniref:alpha/beta hydrolase n=1 Tax=uncultured Chloroflexus sp. TaxID=214040 RepID=UPI0026236229|nr:alpha/beta hydrolase [uncultured Chloroflexus sp.]